MTVSASARQRARCRALIGRATDMSAAPFTLVADDCRGDDGQAATDVLGYFQFPGQEPEDLVHVDGFAVPAASPVARLAPHVMSGPELPRRAEGARIGALSRCTCIAHLRVRYVEPGIHGTGMETSA